MKSKLFIIGTFFTLAISLTGCYTHKLTDREKEIKTFGFDFRDFAEKGFLFTPNEFYGEHYVLGIIRVELHPKVKYKRNDLTREPGYTMYVLNVGNNTAVQLVSIEDEKELIEHIYNMAVEWGGDGFSEFKLEYLTSQTDGLSSTSYSYPSISGVVIKRK
jgi:hypothetical protein